MLFRERKGDERFFLTFALLIRYNKYSERTEQLRADSRKGPSEESPSSTGQGCRITSGEGDFRESAAEIYRRYAVRVKRRGKSPPAFW